MFSKKLAGAAAALSLLFASSAVSAQAVAPLVAPQPAAEESVDEGASEAYGYGALHILGGLAILGALIYLATTVLDNDEPESP